MSIEEKQIAVHPLIDSGDLQKTHKTNKKKIKVTKQHIHNSYNAKRDMQ